MNAQGGTRTPLGPAADTANDGLSLDAAGLLAAACNDASGVIMYGRYGAGSEISVGDKVFNEDSSPRTIARWEGAIEELEKRGLVRAAGSAREVFEVTRDGYAFRPTDAPGTNR
jgi:hypothetical protein